MDFTKCNRFALSISGGGAKGAYAVGVIKYLWECGIRNFRTIVGTSTGALVSTKVALACATGDQKHIEDLEHIFRTIQKPDVASPTRKFIYKLMGQSGLFAMQMISKGKGSIYSNNPLQNLVDQYVTDEDWDILINSPQSVNPVEVGFQVTDLQKAESFTITNETHPDRDLLKKALIASTSIPVLFPLIEFEGKQIADGGIINVMPMEAIFASKYYSQCDGIVSIALDPPYTTEREEKFSGSSKTLLRVFDIFLSNTMHFDYMIGHLINAFNLIKHELSQDSWDKLEEVLPEEVKKHLQLNKNDRNIPIFEIFPKSFLGYGLEFKQPIMSEWVDLGYQSARRKFNLKNEDFSEEEIEEEIEEKEDSVAEKSKEVMEEVIEQILGDAVGED